MFATTSFGMSYPAYAFVMTCTYSWFRIIGKYRTVATVMIMAGVIAAYLGTVLFSVAPILGSSLRCWLSLQSGFSEVRGLPGKDLRSVSRNKQRPVGGLSFVI